MDVDLPAQVPHPAPQAKSAGEPEHKGAEADTLNTAANPDALRDAGFAHVRRDDFRRRRFRQR